MARMLQALKNLEARSAPSTATGGLLAKLIASPPESKPKVEPTPPTTLTTSATQSQEVFDDWPLPVQQPPASAAPANLVAPSIVVNGTVPVEQLAAPPPLIVSLPDVTFGAPASSYEKVLSRPRDFPASRPTCQLERLVRRTLSDPIRSRPLVQLVERLRADIQQSGSKTVLLVGVGIESQTHESALYAASLLAENAADNVLLIDGDLARRSLTVGLEAGQEAGFAELIQGAQSPRDRCRPTGLSSLSLLPAGLLGHTDISVAAQRLDDLLRQLSADFSLVVIDGGRTGDLTAKSLARAADATYFVVRLGAVEASAAQAALHDFRAAGARVIGCIAT